jgi:DNA-binding XRE family transcriptional regulator
MSKCDPVLAALGHNIRARREARDLTQEKLAEKCGLDPTYISGIERGLRNPGMKNVAPSPKRMPSPMPISKKYARTCHLWKGRQYYVAKFASN